MARERTAGRGAARANTGMSRRALVSRLAGLGAVAFLGSCTEGAVAPSPTPRIRRIGYLSGNKQSSIDRFSAPFLQKLRDLGYVNGRDLEVIFRIANNEMDRLPAMAAELIALPVDVIIAEAGPAQRAAKDATKSIPIVCTLWSDPFSLVASVSHPGGNITGVTTGNIEGAAKRVELLKATVPGLARLAVFWNANQSSGDPDGQLSATEKAARALGIETQVAGLHSETETDDALDAIARQLPDALLMLPTLSVVRKDLHQVPDFVAKIRLPAIYSEVEIVRAGGLMHRSPDYAAGHRRAAVMVDKILRGANPGDIPVEQPTQFLFSLNLSAAHRIGLTIPNAVFLQATEVIR